MCIIHGKTQLEIWIKSEKKIETEGEKRESGGDKAPARRPRGPDKDTSVSQYNDAWDTNFL